MLILTRKLGQSIIINDNVKITVTEISGKQVKLGIDAPTSVPVHRWEVYQRIQEENRKAADAKPNKLKDLSSFIISRGRK